MEDRMKVMIAYDGSTYADAALDDLRRAGLPREGEALVVTVADGLVSTSSSIADVAGAVLTSSRVRSGIAAARDHASRLLEEERGFAAEANGRLRSYFPNWEVRAAVLEGSPSRELLQEAERWQPDLVVVGSQGRSALGRFFLGSVSKEVATNARCSVRVARCGGEKDDGAPLRLIVGVDGSPGAASAIRAVGVREWPVGTEVRLIAVDDGNGHTRITDLPPSLEEMVMGFDEGSRMNARLMAEGARVVLLDEGLSASVKIRDGDPQRVLIDDAREWGADSIFVGSHGMDHLDERSSLGSASAALVTNATCSVEVVR